MSIIFKDKLCPGKSKEDNPEKFDIKIPMQLYL